MPSLFLHVQQGSDTGADYAQTSHLCRHHYFTCMILQSWIEREPETDGFHSVFPPCPRQTQYYD